MAKERKPLSTDHKDYWCRIGNHHCHRFDLVVTEKKGQYGICKACVRKQTGGKGLSHYWTTDKID